MKRLLLVLASLLFSTEAFAACAVTNLQVKDNAAVTAAVPYADDGSGASNCAPQVQIKQGGNVVAVINNNADAVAAAAANLASATFNYGWNGATWDRLQVDGSKNLKVVFGSAQAVTQSGTWTVQPGNTANTTPWLFTLNQGGSSATAAPTAYGTAPGAGNVIPVNAFVTNANTNGINTAANSSPVVIANDQTNSTTGNIVANNTTAVVVNAAATTLYSIQLGGIGSAPAYLKLYNATSATCGSGTPVKRLIIPAAATAANGAGSNVVFPLGLRFSTGLTYCVTTGIGDADTTAPAASTYLVNLDWR